MPRVARIVLPGLPHHVTHRGNRRHPVFFGGADRKRYVRLLAGYAARYSLEIWAYCLMANHIHLLVVPVHESSMANAIGRAHMSHARAINRGHRWTGHLWANRYYSAPVERSSAPSVARYIELNPVRAGIAPAPETYPWSSAPAHCLGKADFLLDVQDPLGRDPTSWREWLHESPDAPEADSIRRHTSTGTPVGSNEFVAALECKLGRRLTRRRYERHK